MIFEDPIVVTLIHLWAIGLLELKMFELQDTTCAAGWIA